MSKEQKYTLEPVQDLISIPGEEVKQEMINHLRTEVIEQLDNETKQ